MGSTMTPVIQKHMALMSIMSGPGGVVIKDRTENGKVYPNCFVGSELVTWLVDLLLATNRINAVEIGENMRKQGIFHHVTSQYSFQDNNFLYQFAKKKKNRSASCQSL